MALLLLTLSVVLLAVLGRSDGLAIPGDSGWLQFPQAVHAPSPVPVTDVACAHVYDCLQTNQVHQNFNDVMARFDVGEVSSRTDGWCAAPSHNCWDDLCTASYFKRQVEFQEFVLGRVCQDRDALRSLATCMDEPLGQRLANCQTQALDDLSKATASIHPVAFSNYFLVCASDLIGSLPVTCTQNDQRILFEFVRFVVLENLTLMGW